MKELDAFPKVPESYVETSASGGTGRPCRDADSDRNFSMRKTGICVHLKPAKIGFLNSLVVWLSSSPSSKDIVAYGNRCIHHSSEGRFLYKVGETEPNVKVRNKNF